VKFVYYICFSILLILPLTGYADGNALLTKCSSAISVQDDNGNYDDLLGAGLCIGLIQGVSEMITAGNTWGVCFHGGVKRSQMIRVVTQYLRGNPKHLHYPETALVLIAFKEAWPCPK